ncbi:MAG: GatB/YqeY domain-containing protein [Acidimicrobiia bacterium]|nr:GatB/YqeY domain-containing protein [Acidimicrobiia bacterium]MDH3396507.1 GatB/YqeY domain-containing protein [Acidimicrobiia bacterium]
MSIKDELVAELHDAMRSGDRRRREVVREIETQVSRKRAEAGFVGQVDDDLYVEIMGNFAKKMDKAANEYEGLGERGADMAAKLRWEVDYLARWLPTKLSEVETRKVVREAIAELEADDPKMAGFVVGHLMKSMGKDLDGGLVNRVVREELESG